MSKLSFKHYLHPKNWPVLLGLGILRLLSLLPLPTLRKLGVALGRLLFHLGKRRRHIAEVNLKLCFPEKSEAERTLLVKEVFENTGMGMIELAWSWYAPLKKLKAACVIKGQEHITDCIKNGQGVLLLTFHFTSLELGAALLGSQQDNIVGMYRPHKNSVFDAAMSKGRRRTMEPVARGNVRHLIKAMKQQQIVWYASDQNYGVQQGVFVPFFGIPAATITATSWFAEKGKAQVIPMTNKRTPNGMEITIHPALENFPSGDDKEDARVNMAFLEDYLKQYPADYMWVHRRFKTRPEGEKGVY